MCPACIASAAVMAAGAGSHGRNSGGVHRQIQKLFRPSGLGPFQKIKEK